MPSKPIVWLSNDGEAETYGHRPELRYNLLPYMLLKSDSSWKWSSCPLEWSSARFVHHHLVCRFLDREGELKLASSCVCKRYLKVSLHT
jgi:hypothetical protein